MSENMIFCLGDGQYESSGEGYQKNHRIFNIDVSKDIYEKAINTKPSFELSVSIWRKEEDMTKEEKKNVSTWSQMGGYLKTLSYKDAWAEAWPKASDDFKKWVKGLPNFSPEIFENITGLTWDE
jgi:hypothetical protein